MYKYHVVMYIVYFLYGKDKVWKNINFLYVVCMYMY